VTGIQWRFVGTKPSSFNLESRPGYTLSLNAELPGTVLGTRKIEVTRALTLEGVRLESPPTLVHHITGRSESPMSRTNVSFDIELKSPPLDSKGLAEVSGFVECDSAENQRTGDLTTASLRGGAKGDEFGAELESVGTR